MTRQSTHKAKPQKDYWHISINNGESLMGVRSEELRKISLVALWWLFEEERYLPLGHKNYFRDPEK